MSRTVPTQILTALARPNVNPFLAVEMLFDTEPLRLWTGLAPRNINAETYAATGQLLEIGGLEEVSTLSSTVATLTLTAISSSMVALALDEPYQGRPCAIYFGCTDVAEVVEVFSGQMNTMTIEDSGKFSRITLTIDSKLVLLDRKSERRYTHESHIARHPGDTFFSYVADLQDRQIVWGRAG
ncbi:MAG: hypothetical protein AAF801_09880 [Pseudomonadota bacterium]